MRSLVWFELKKMLARRVALVVNVGMLVLLVVVMALNVAQTMTMGDDGQTISGPAAIAHMRAEDEAHAGVLEPAKVAADIAAYREKAFARIDPAQIASMTDAAAYSLVCETYGEDAVWEFYSPYNSFLLNVWDKPGEDPIQIAARVTPEMANDWYGAVAQLTQNALDDGQGGSWVYSDAERAYWTDMQARVPAPLSYGYVGGWENIINCAAFLVLAIIAVCVTAAPVFAGEYQAGTDAVVLATRYGRSRLIAAKTIAVFLYAVAYFALAASIVCCLTVAFHGAGGLWLPVQNISLSSPYPLSAGEAALLSVGLMGVACLGFAAFTLFLSSRMRSTLPVFVVDVALLMLTGMVPSAGNGVLAHLFALFPLGFSNFSQLFAALNSYAVGPVVADLIGMVVVVYAALTLAAVPAAALSFRRHQVS